MKSLGGAIKVDSTEGKGTTFLLAIPVRHIAGTSAYTNEEGVETSLFVTEGDNKTKEDKVSTTDKETTATILVVEDNADVAAYIGKRLSGKYKIVYAKTVSMSYSQLYRKLSALTGMTPVQYIQRVKVAKAKQMLSRHPEMSLNIVAEQCGFFQLLKLRPCIQECSQHHTDAVCTQQPQLAFLG